MFWEPEAVDVSPGEAKGNIDSRGSIKHTVFPRCQSISILLYTKSQRNEKNKTNFIRKYMKNFIKFPKNVKFNSTQCHSQNIRGFRLSKGRVFS